MKRVLPTILLLTLLLLPLALTGAGRAQAPKPISISLGVFLPATSQTRARATSALATAEVRYALPAEAAAMSRTLLGISASHSSRGEGSTIITGTVGQSFSLTGGRSPLLGQTGYAGIGVGLYGMDLNGAHAFFRPGAYAEAGYNVTDTLFLNAQYRLVDRAAGATLALGVRF